MRDIGRPQATLPWLSGMEDAPGSWTFDIEAGSLDQMVYSTCGGQSDQFRYDVDNPQLFPGPTSVIEIVPRPDRQYTSVVGTDCPAGTSASVTITAAGGYSYSGTAVTDGYGNWELPIPTSAPHGDLTVNASCGSVHFASLVMPFGTPEGGTPGTVTTSNHEAGSPPSTSVPASPKAAAPVEATPRYTG